MASALIHPQSCPATKTELDLWALPPTQMAIARKYKVEFRPIAALAGESPLIEFLIPASAEPYYDFNATYLKVRLKVKLVKTDNNVKTDVAIAAASRDKFSPVNNLLHSLFQRIDLELNGKLVTATSTHYPYRAYIETLMTYDATAEKTHLKNIGWKRDTDFGLRSGRDVFVGDDGEIDLYGRLYLDLFDQGRLMLGGIEAKLTLQAQKPSFYFMTAANHSIEVQWEHVALFLTCAKLYTPIQSAHEKALAQNPAKYPITRVEVKECVVPANVGSFNFDQVWNGQLPRRMLMVMVDNAAENGSFSTNPFKFEHFEVNELTCNVNGENYPPVPMTPDFSKKQVKEEYQNLFDSMEQVLTRPTLNITPEEFISGYTIFCWNFAPDFADGCSTHWNVVKRGYCRMRLVFANVLPKVISVLFIAEFDNLVQVDKDRNVTTDY